MGNFCLLFDITIYNYIIIYVYFRMVFKYLWLIKNYFLIFIESIYKVNVIYGYVS